LILANYNINRRLYSSFILDINEAGAFIETDRAFPAGDKIVINFLDPHSRRSSLIIGFIAWSSDAAIGVKFNYHLFTPF
jgi:Tfp pilus assembly protein PilZ